MHVISLPMIFIFLSYERKEASVGVTTVASSTAGTVVFFKKRNSTKSWWFLRPSNSKVGSGPVIWRLISHCYCGAMTWVTLPWSSACMARGTRRWMSHMSAKGVLLSVSPFRVRTDPAWVVTPTRQEQPTTWFCSLVNPNYIDLKRYVLNYPLRLGFLFVGVSVYRACT